MSFENTSDLQKGEDAFGHILTSLQSNTPPFPVTWFPLVAVGVKTDDRALDVGIVPTSYIASMVLVVQRPKLSSSTDLSYRY